MDRGPATFSFKTIMGQEYTDPYDFVVVGAGVAGIIVTAKIAQQGVDWTQGNIFCGLMVHLYNQFWALTHPVEELK